MPTTRTVDMTAKVGGRIVTPALAVVDASDPTPVERTFNDSLQRYIDENIPLESTEGIQRRERALNKMGAIAREWIRSVCTRRGLPLDVIENAGGQLFTSGSYRLGVHEPGADIDTILVAPNMCTRQDFFGAILEEKEDGTVVRDPESLAERLKAHPDVTNFVPVEGAMIPLLTFDFEGVNIDLLFAKLNSASVPASLDIDNDSVLDGVDSATEKSLNGPRVTNLIAALVGQTPERYQTFLTVVRCVRKWAKARGLYSNKSGYWGGVNINITVALTVQLYPNDVPASILRKFFMLFKTWRWPNPVKLTEPYDAGLGYPVWAQNQASNKQVAPIITPAYPAMNSTLAISRQTLQIMTEEFSRGEAIANKLWKRHRADPSAELDWSTLFEPSDFFIRYPNYLSICIVGPTQHDVQAWAGFVESRLRKLVSDMLARSLPLKKIQLWPKKLEACVADRAALLNQAQRMNSITYFVGFQADTVRMKGTQLNVEGQLVKFRQEELSRYHPLKDGMDVLIKPFKMRELPRMCFESLGGKEKAIEKFKAMRDADPIVRANRDKRKLEALKAKMAEIQRRKQEEAAAAKEKDAMDDDDDETEEGGQKRKRDDDDNEDETDDLLERESKLIKAETDLQNTQDDANEDDDDEELDEEAKMLEQALDTMQQGADAGAKTREEAEAERRKLLAGEYLDVGEAVESDDEDETGYAGDLTRQVVPTKKVKASVSIRSLPLPKEDAELLKKLGCPVVSDEETKLVGIKESVKDSVKPMARAKITFRKKFDIVELDANGRIVDKGDEDFEPSKSWTGRKAGFEFKLGERGLGYYRTGKKVVIPSNTAY